MSPFSKVDARAREDVRGLYERYVVFHADLQGAEADCVAPWTLHTWALEAKRAEGELTTSWN
jgi:hypothetical protein